MGRDTQQLKKRAGLAQATHDLDTYEPVVVRPAEEEVEQLHLFSIVGDDGEEQKFFIPKKVKFNVTLKATKMLASQGEYAAGEFMLRALIGDEGWEALSECEDISEEQFEQITQIASTVVLGPSERRGKGR